MWLFVNICYVFFSIPDSIVQFDWVCFPTNYKPSLFGMSCVSWTSIFRCLYQTQVHMFMFIYLVAEWLCLLFTSRWFKPGTCLIFIVHPIIMMTTTNLTTGFSDFRWLTVKHQPVMDEKSTTRWNQPNSSCFCGCFRTSGLRRLKSGLPSKPVLNKLVLHPCVGKVSMKTVFWCGFSCFCLRWCLMFPVYKQWFVFFVFYFFPGVLSKSKFFTQTCWRCDHFCQEAKWRFEDWRCAPWHPKKFAAVWSSSMNMFLLLCQYK